MDQLIVTGNGPLKGEVHISGAKNAALPCLAATILTEDAVHLTNLPEVNDIATMCDLLAGLGKTIERDGTAVTISGALNSHIAPYEMVTAMRASILVLGPLLGRLGQAKVSLPGGCAIGARPVDLHISALRKMGAEIRIEHGDIDAQVSRLKGTDIIFDKVTVTGTENIMMAAVLADGCTMLHNAAREPEVVDLANLLMTLGARIEGAGTDTIKINGVSALHGGTHRIIPDRIETGTYVCAAAITRGHVNICNTDSRYLKAFLDSISKAGLPLKFEEDCIEVLPHKGLVGVDIQTQPHPGFPTDMQAQFMAVMTQAVGHSLISEKIFENRFNHVAELSRMGANIKINGDTAIATGPTPLSGARVIATDLRASASLVVAALVADGETLIDKIYHLDRGYVEIESKLLKVGALIKRVTVAETDHKG